MTMGSRGSLMRLNVTGAAAMPTTAMEKMPTPGLELARRRQPKKTGAIGATSAAIGALNAVSQTTAKMPHSERNVVANPIAVARFVIFIA